MELREYLRILVKRLWIILPLTFLALVTSLWFSYQQTPIYEASSTYVAKLNPNLLSAPSDTLIYGIDTLAGRQRIFVTYCEVMTSRTVREQAYELLAIDLTKTDLNEDYDVECSNLVETNVLSISVQGPSPELALQLNKAIGIVGTVRANTLYNSFPLEDLDAPKLEDELVSPKTTRNGILGGMLGLVIGIMLALLIEYLRTPFERMEEASIRNVQLGTYNERYFRQRFQQEINRPYAKLRPMSLALLKIVPNEEFHMMPENVQISMLRNVALTIQDTIKHRSDVIGYMGEHIFGILLTETSRGEARTILQQLHNEIRSKTFEAGSYVTTFTANTGVISGSGDTMEVQRALHAAAEALAIAETQGENAIHLVATTPQPFVTGQDDDDTGTEAPANGAVFNITEDELFGDDAENVNWPAVLPDQEPPDTNDQNSRQPRRRHRLVKPRSEMPGSQTETSETDEQNDDLPPAAGR